MAKKFVVIADLRGGMNSADPPLSLPENQCVDATNVDWYDGLIARKRNGADNIALTGGTAPASGIQALFRFQPTSVETTAEMWLIDGQGTPLVKRLAAGTTWADVTMADAITSFPQLVNAVSFNGKLYLAFASAQSRLHCYDPALATPQVRRVGLAASGAPTVADTGAGAYAATLRYYKQDTIQLNGTIVVRRSELSAKVSFTPSGGGTAARVTRGTFPGEQETHWRVWGSSDDTTYYNISGNIAVATTTYDDSAAPSSYSTNTAQEPTGTFTLFRSTALLATDGNRLLTAGDYASTNTSRIWFSPVLGSLDQGDDERTRSTTTQKDYVDLNENDGGGLTALAVLDGAVYAFKYRQYYKLTPTGDVSVPYLVKRKSISVGCVAQKSVVVGEDEAGRAALYFYSHKGPYRIGANGLQYLGRDTEDVWATVNLGATTTVVHAVYHADKHQMWFWISTGSNNSPDTKMIFDVLLGRPNEYNQVRGGWAKHTGYSAAAICSTMFSKTAGASMSRDLKPYIGALVDGDTHILMCDSTNTSDRSTNFQATIKTRPILPTSSLGRNLWVGETYLLAKAASGVTITQIIDRDFGLETRTTTASLTAAASETRVYRKLEVGELAGAGMVQLQLGDGSALSNAWTLDAIVAPVENQEQR